VSSASRDMHAIAWLLKTTLGNLYRLASKLFKWPIKSYVYISCRTFSLHLQHMRH